MDKHIVDLAVTIKGAAKGSGPKLDNFVIGKVVSVSPLKISIDEAIILDGQDLYALEYALVNLQNGENVALVPSTNYQQFLMLGRVVSF